MNLQNADELAPPTPKKFSHPKSKKKCMDKLQADLLHGELRYFFVICKQRKSLTKPL